MPKKHQRDHSTIGMPPRQIVHRIERESWGWRLWLSPSADYTHGIYLELHNTGKCRRVVSRIDEGDEWFVVRPPDHVITMIEVNDDKEALREDSQSLSSNTSV